MSQYVYFAVSTGPLCRGLHLDRRYLSSMVHTHYFRLNPSASGSHKVSSHATSWWGSWSMIFDFLTKMCSHFRRYHVAPGWINVFILKKQLWLIQYELVMTTSMAQFSHRHRFLFYSQFLWALRTGYCFGNEATSGLLSPSHPLKSFHARHSA